MKKSCIPSAPTAVFKKFYSDICTRVADSCASVGMSRIYPAVMAVIDSYMAAHAVVSDDGNIVREKPGEFAPENVSAPMIMLIFTLLRPEIDRVMSRSAPARRRASLRRRVGIDDAAVADRASNPTPASAENRPLPVKTRRERRLEEQARNRSSRPRLKRLWG